MTRLIHSYRQSRYSLGCFLGLVRLYFARFDVCQLTSALLLDNDEYVLSEIAVNSESHFWKARYHRFGFPGNRTPYRTADRPDRSGEKACIDFYASLQSLTGL